MKYKCKIGTIGHGLPYTSGIFKVKTNISEAN